jgi:hypothetical protein
MCEDIDVNTTTTDNGATPLAIVCDRGHTEVVEMLLVCDGFM